MADTSPTGRLAILVGGGPAPGINGVIAAVTIQGIYRGMEVIGCQDGFRYLVQGRTDKTRRLTIDDVRPFALRGGSMLGTARTKPSEEQMTKVLEVFEKLGVTDLVTIGGDDTASSASRVKQRAGARIRVAHVPKTIDNDLPLPGTTPTFGFETARHYGVQIARSMLEDARTTSRWYILVSMGRAAGHLALGIGKAARAPLTLIPEEFDNRPLTLESLCDLIIGSILKSKLKGYEFGIAVLAEGLIETIGVESLERTLGGRDRLEQYGKLRFDEHGNPRLGEIAFGRMVKDFLEPRIAELGLKMTFVEKDIGYELRCIDPIPFDSEYTRDLGFAAVKFLASPEAAEYGAIISVVDGRLHPLRFEEKLDPSTSKMGTRRVDVTIEKYECARRFMDRLEPSDFEDAERVEKLAKLVNLTPDQFRARFGGLVS
ncbi:MAG TPA: diphosphate--fructose-6-phosphate 1-phosphotransferase [Gemmataceae bacterium]